MKLERNNLDLAAQLIALYYYEKIVNKSTSVLTQYFEEIFDNGIASDKSLNENLKEKLFSVEEFKKFYSENSNLSEDFNENIDNKELKISNFSTDDLKKIVEFIENCNKKSLDCVLLSSYSISKKFYNELKYKYPKSKFFCLYKEINSNPEPDLKKKLHFSRKLLICLIICLILLAVLINYLVSIKI